MGRGRQRPGRIRVADALAAAMTLHREGKLANAAELYENILQAVPAQPDALHYYGVLCHQRGQSEKAARLIQSAIQLQPDYAAAYNNLGNVYKEQGRAADAAEMYRRLISLQPDHAEAYNNLGVALKQLGRYDEAVAAYNDALRRAPRYADAYHNLGNALKKLGRVDEALSAYRQAILLKPQHSDAYLNLGRLLYAAGRTADAVAVYEQWLAQEPDNPVARHMRAACSGEGVPTRASDAYVRQTFDHFAGSFDVVLKRLDYQAPALVAAAVAQQLGSAGAQLAVLDAGCGTGLCGPLLRPYARRLSGVDLSPGMLSKAAGRDVYDELVQAELTEFLGAHAVAWDLIVSADTLCYFGALDAICKATAGALRAEGRFVFTVELATAEDAPQGYHIAPHGRYGHTRALVRTALMDTGLEVLGLDEVTLRLEAGNPVAGLLVVASHV